MLVKIKYVDFWPEFDYKQDFIYCSLLRCGYDVRLVDTDPDYIIYSVFGDEHLKYDCIRIFYTGEDVSPDFNVCDYAIGFDPLTFGDRFLRLPLFYHALYTDDFERMMNRQDQISSGRAFCSYTVTNGDGAPERTEFFELLSAYKKVDSGGRYRNNVGGPVKDKLAFDRQHKFSICFENASHPGYITEKILHAFAAGCIPIYWGAPDIEETFNGEAFVNVHRYGTLQQAAEAVIQIDQDDALYRQMLAQPALASEACTKEHVYAELDAFVRNIFEQPLPAARRTACSVKNEMYIQRLRSVAQREARLAFLRKLKRLFRR